MNLAKIENKLFVLSHEVGVAAYDFDFDLHFACVHPYRIEGEHPCVLRTGPIPDYAAEFEEQLGTGLRLVNSPAEHALASEIEHWYPLIRKLTPRTQVFEVLPSPEQIEAHFAWPVFLKGSRQTSHHDPDLSVIMSRSHYERVAQSYRRDPILRWQKPAVREFVPLVPVSGQVPGKVRPSLEYRSFWWHGVCVGWGRYWHQVPAYGCPDVEAGLQVAAQAAARLRVPFVAIDFACCQDGRWIVVECNDAQESGYAGVPPLVLWRRLLAQVGAEG